MKKIVLALLLFVGSVFAFEHLNTENFDIRLKGKNAIVDFYATWCPPCKVLSRNLEDFDIDKPDNVEIFKVDIDKNMDLARKYNVRSLPTIIYFKDGKVVSKDVGIKNKERLLLDSINYFN